MRTSYRTARPAFLLSLATFLASVLQGQDLASLDMPPGHNRTSTRLHAPTDDPMRRPIHDDGDTEARVPSTNQLMVVCGSERPMALTLDILNERGHVVRHHVLDPTQGQHIWAVDVNDLRTGRYVARVTCARGAVVNRFRRD